MSANPAESRTARRNRLIRAARAKARPDITDWSHDRGAPTRPVGHARGVQTSVDIVRGYRRAHRPRSLHVEPQAVLDTLTKAGIRRWVLMGLYGYVGYLAEPRATQDVDVLVAEDEIEAAIAAIQSRWPALIVDRTPVVIRFRDPGEVDLTGETKPVIDLMLPNDACYEAILETHHRVEPSTGHRVPVLEAACASKFAALVSPNRRLAKKAFDAGDLRNLFVPAQHAIDRQRLAELGELVYPGGGAEILEFLDLAIADKPFPV